jgi:Domain of unknown function (DUF4082)
MNSACVIRGETGDETGAKTRGFHAFWRQCRAGCLILSCVLAAWLGVAGVAQAQTILLITSSSNNFSKYYEEILRAEGLNSFATVDINAVTASVLAPYDVALLGEMPLTATQVSTLSTWVQRGGNLVAMRPDAQLAPLLGLTATGTSLAEGYLLVNTNSVPGKGIVGETIQYHGSADRYALNGASSLATLYSNTTTATTNPAVVWRNVGNAGGLAAAFTYDLARSVVYTRQGNPAYAGQERDGIAPRRPDDLFFPDYVNLDKVSIPQADEQQRLLANLIVQMSLRKKPMPRFWYLPSGLKAALVHTLDDHNSASGTRDTVDKLIARSAPGCNVADWQCLRATVWAFTGISLTDAQAANYQAQGFEFGVHAENGCTVDFNSFAELDSSYRTQLQQFRTLFPSVSPQTTSRFHCIVWSDWLTQPRVQLANGIRYSMDYYYWPGDTWVKGRPGVFTGSGLPMRFADIDGSVVDVYQGVSQLVNENGLSYPNAIYAVLDKALGAEGYYGLFGTHDDYRDTNFLEAVITAATSRGVPVISAKQALNWLDARNASSFSAQSFSGGVLSFTVNAAAGARNLYTMLPLRNTTNTLTAVTANGVAVPFSTQTIKGIEYAMFAVTSGSYSASYNGALPALASNGFTLWPASTLPQFPSWSDPNAVELGVKFQADRAGRISGIRFYKGAGNTGVHTVNLWSNAGVLLASANAFIERATGWQEALFDTPVAIQAGVGYVASYYARRGNYAVDPAYFAVNDWLRPPLRALATGNVGGNGVYKYGASGFPTLTFNANNYWVDPIFTDTPTATLWGNTTPAIAAFPDNSANELGLKFRTSVDGDIVGIRFYKGVGNGGPHTGSLWSEVGTLLATGNFANETASGWQEMTFSAPVPVLANTTYVASYFAPQGNYAVNQAYFNVEYVNGSLRAPASATVGGNGLYRAGASGFPSSSFNANHYWVDVIFRPR